MYRSGLRMVNVDCVLQCFRRQSSIVARRCIYRGKGGGISVFTTPQSADVFVACLNEEERLLLREALRIHDQADVDTGKENSDPPSVKQLRLVAFHNAIPFIGFGFLDNAIMIIAGEYIDLTIGMTLGISTMAAAALGNIVSDVCGIGLAHYVEAATNRLGFESPNLSSKQTEMPRTRFVTNLGRALGIVVGCFIGMFPLLFYKSKEDHEEKSTPSES
ncbi:transmembrane protein 65-like [Stylophora pistillata]|uniref:Transmembrane protein 65 n=1 Tax=Stylophora pistillata TaxID=50429 RepID=A0A2B4RM64_STYPI|nr:transmembrane protein 65-like [Stylophora pistillata]PFX17427.1 Transmembrane protein 65 [Stylophora pistillata]